MACGRRVIALGVLVVSFPLSSFALSPGAVYAPFAPVQSPKVYWLSQDLENRGFTPQWILNAWAVERSDSSTHDDIRWLTVPPQTGRGTRSDQTMGLGGIVFLKGTGLNPETQDQVSRIRFDPTTRVPTVGDGFFTVREAAVDQWTSEVMASYGVRVPKPLAIISLNKTQADKKALAGIYARRFIAETRLSNLDVMSKDDALHAFSDAAEALHKEGITPFKMDLVQHYFYLLRTMADTVATLEHVGYEHRYFHWQQISLAGELADLGTGTWTHGNDAPIYPPAPTLPYMRFENQPLLGLNMFIRTHAMRASPPARLEAESETLQTQRNSLLGIIRRINPAAAKEIESLKPEETYWKAYEERKAELKLHPLKPASTSEGFSRTEFDLISKFEIPKGMTYIEVSQGFRALKQSLNVEAVPDAIAKQTLGLLTKQDRPATTTWSTPLRSLCGSFVRALTSQPLL